MKQTRISVNLDGLEDLASQLGDRWIARVGILGSHVQRQETEQVEYGGKIFNKKTGKPATLSNSEIGVIHEFGAKNIPARSFLRMPIEYKKEDIVKTMSGSTIAGLLQAKKYKQIYYVLGVKAEEVVDQAFNSGGFGQWLPLAQRTIDAKGSSAPLIDTSELRKSISSDVVKKEL